MPRTDPIQGITSALSSESPDGAANQASIVDQVVVKLNMRFATTAARDAAISTPNRKAGMIAYIDALGYHQCVKTDAGSWVRLAAEDLFLGSEGSSIGTAPSAGTMKIRKDWSRVDTTDANGDIASNFIGGPFPNGVVTLTVTPGDVTAAGFIIPRLSVSTLSYVWTRCYGFGGSVLGAGAGIRLNITAIGW